MAITVKYNGTSIVPRPNVSVSQSYVRTGDGRKVGVTYSISLSGTIVSTGSTTEDRFKSLFSQAKTIRDNFREDGKLLEIESTGAPVQTLSFYPRVISIDFPDSQYVSTLPYTVSLEADCIESDSGCYGSDGTASAQDDIKKQLGLGSDFNTNVFVSTASDEWSIQQTEQRKGNILNGSSVSKDSEESYSPVYTVTHTISANGKRSYDSSGLIRSAWQNAELFCLSRVGIPDSISADMQASGDSTIDVLLDGIGGEETGTNANLFTVNEANNSSTGYGVYNYTKQQNVSQTEGTYSITETFTLAKSSGDGVSATSTGNAITQITVDTAIDENTQTRTDSDRLITVTVSGTITGLESRSVSVSTIGSGATAREKVTVNSFSTPTQTKGQAALIEYQNYSDSTLNAIAKALSTTSGTISESDYTKANLVVTPISRTSNINSTDGVISFSAVFNTRKQTIAGTISETGTYTKNKGLSKKAVIEAPNHTSGPIVQNLATKSMTTETMTVEVVYGRSTTSKPYIHAGTMHAICKAPSDGIFRSTGVSTSGKQYVQTADNETWNPQSRKYTRTLTYQWYSGSC
tara:strand:+ start:163 stop:1893 length:1731 start_codon:yes stop_codon:yes gene_type:complete